MRQPPMLNRHTWTRSSSFGLLSWQGQYTFELQKGTDWEETCQTRFLEECGRTSVAYTIGRILINSPEILVLPLLLFFGFFDVQGVFCRIKLSQQKSKKKKISHLPQNAKKKKKKEEEEEDQYHLLASGSFRVWSTLFVCVVDNCCVCGRQFLCVVDAFCS